MAASVGVLTGTGGLVSHAAVVARGWGIPAVVGASALRIDEGGAELGTGTRIVPGDVVTIDGSTGEVWLGEVAGSTARPEQEEEVLSLALPELGVLAGWAAESADARSGTRP
jgi:pyruvate,orthophosphate dikinase